MTQGHESHDDAWREFTIPGLMGVLGPMLGRKKGGHWLYGLRVREDHLNQARIVHGGTITTLMDQAISAIAWSHANKTPCVTVQLNVSFVGAAKLGDLLVASGHVVKATGSLLFVEGNIAVNDAVIATAQGIMKRVNPN